jgi:flagellar basal body-associated protein FliL
MLKKKLLIVAIAVLVIAGGAYKFLLSSADAGPRKVDGSVYVLPKEFLVNLSDGRYAKFTVALLLKDDPAAHGGEGTPPEGYGSLPEEAVVRGIVTDVVGGTDGPSLSNSAGREKVKRSLRRRLAQSTDLKVNDVFFPDVTVQ